MSIRQQWAQHRQAREDLVTNAIQTTDQWIEQLKDPEIGAIGHEFWTDFIRSECGQEIDIHHHTGPAHFTSFQYSGDRRGFVNHIVYGPGAEEDIANLFSSKTHEATHALQKTRSAALHASPFNPHTRIVVCPRDWILLEERCEADAYTKQAWFNSLLSRHLPEVLTMTELDAVSAREFIAVREKAASLHDALVSVAAQSLNKSLYWDNPDSDIRFRHHYHDVALTNYHNGMIMRQHHQDLDLVFVRIEPEDIWAIGASCGPNSFGVDALHPLFMAPPQLVQASKEKLCYLNSELGIWNEDCLPSLSEALSNMGISRQDFIQKSYLRPTAATPAPLIPAPALAPSFA